MEEGLRVYAIGDVHGYLETLLEMEAAIEADIAKGGAAENIIIYLGDYIDRGPDSAGVIEHLHSMKQSGGLVRRHFLMGNHELALFEFLTNPEYERWLKWGGEQTCASYGVTIGHEDQTHEKDRAAEEMMALIPQHHMAFYQSLEKRVIYGGYLFAHAGIDPYKPIEKQTVRDLTSIRQPFLSWYKDEEYKPLEKRVVHGHSISKEPIERVHRVGVDTGLYEGGKLTAAVIEGADVRFVQV